MVNQSDKEEVIVIGLGYVGLTLSAYLASIGMSVHGVEVRDAVLSDLGKHKAFFLEENLDEMLDIVIKNKLFSFSKSIPNSKNQRTFIITVGTPLTENQMPNLDFIIRAATEVANILNDNDLVILRSTVKLGVTNSIVRPILNSSNKRFGLAFCPERTLEGSALSEIGFLPQIIGADSEEDLTRATFFFEKITSTVVKVSNIETAEMIKLVDNMQRDTHFAVSNEVARMCNQVNVKASEVIAAGKNNYPRTNLPTPGPVGGPCLEKDTYLLNESFILPFSLSKTARMVNEAIISDSLDYFKTYFGNRISKRQPVFRIAVIGLAFKGVPETNDLRGSMALRVITSIREEFDNVEICGYDPVVMEKEIIDLKIQFAKTYVQASDNTDLVLLMNNHPKISEIKLDLVASKMKSEGMIYDYWGRFDNVKDLPNKVVMSSWGSHGTSIDGKLNG